MASEAITEPETTATTEDMDLENPNPVTNDTPIDGATKRDREEAEDTEENGGAIKKQKVDDDDKEEKSVEEVRMEKLEEDKENEGENEKENEKPDDPVGLGPKTFGSAVDMFEYFYQLLHRWPMNLKLNKYEHLVLLELIKKGHPEPEKKIGSGINAFVIHKHPEWNSRCFFVVRADESEEDFSFRKCVDHILPLPENMKIKKEANQALAGGGKKGGRGGGRGGGHGRGRGRGGRGRRG